MRLHARPPSFNTCPSGMDEVGLKCLGPCFSALMLTFELIPALYRVEGPDAGMGCVQGMGIERTSSELEASQYAPGETLPLDLQELL
jgi:hypothetical protein